jgi:hypothetical protein
VPAWVSAGASAAGMEAVDEDDGRSTSGGGV